MRWSVLFIGCHGATASTLIAAVLGDAKNADSFQYGSYWATISGGFPEAIRTVSLGGWDYRHSSIERAVVENDVLPREFIPFKIPFHYFPAVIGPTDYAARADQHPITSPNLSDAIDLVRTQIESVRTQSHADRIIVINTGSPMASSSNEKEWSSTTAYSEAAVLEGCDWVEFTPSDSITARLRALADSSGSHLAGRDGSTGQTILKLLLRDFFTARGLRIDHWYSANLIGNHDGVVLSHPDYRATKILDKTSVLDGFVADPGRHQVDISLVPPTGDNKESWDAVFFSGWMSQRMSLRLNWHGRDSILAAPLLLDIIAGLMHAHELRYRAGIVTELGVFFKHPMGVDRYTFNSLLEALQDFARRKKGFS